MKSGEELYSKIDHSPEFPQRIVLKPNLHCGHQDTTSSDARTSVDHSDKHGGTYRETCRGEIDFRIQGLPHSVVQEHDHIRKKAVQKLIHQFENHPNKEALREDQQLKRAFNLFSEQSKEMIYSIRNMEYFEICEITPNIQCSNCMTYWPKGITRKHLGSRAKQFGTKGPMNQREYYEEAKKFCQRLSQESGQAHHRLHPREQGRSRPDQPFAWHDGCSERVDPKTGWNWYDTQQTPSSSSSGWQPSAWWQSSSWSQTPKWCERYIVFTNVYRFQAISIPL